MASSRPPATSDDIEQLREICKAEIRAARAIEFLRCQPFVTEEDKPAVYVWTAAHSERMKATHPVRILRVLELLDRTQESLSKCMDAYDTLAQEHRELTQAVAEGTA